MAASCDKEYCWVLCDDDFYSWDCWTEIEQAISDNKFQLIYSCTQLLRDKNDIAQRCHQATFVPGCIYATAIITDNVLQNMYNNIYTLFSQCMISANIICSRPDKIFVPSNTVVLRIPSGQENDKTLIRGLNQDFIHPDTQLMFWHIGFIKAIQIVKNKKQKDYIVEHVRFNEIFEQTFSEYIYNIIQYNKKNKKGNLKNLFELFYYLNFSQKIRMLLVLIVSKFIFFYSSPNDYYVELFGCLKTKIWSKKPKKYSL